MEHRYAVALIAASALLFVAGAGTTVGDQPTHRRVADTENQVEMLASPAADEVLHQATRGMALLPAGCDSRYYFKDVQLFWPAPHRVRTDTAYAQRFSALRAETLKYVDVWIYDCQGFPSGCPFGNNDVTVTIYADSNGLPTEPVAHVTLPSYSYLSFPSPTRFDFSGFNLVVWGGDFHVAFSSSGTLGVDCECCMSSGDLPDGILRSSSISPSSGGWVYTQDALGLDVDFLFEVGFCSSCPIALTGDVNVNGVITSADIIALVNYVFKSGALPQPCAAAGDINCSGAVTSGDIIALVNFVFKSGSPPCDACTSPLAAEC